jgi:hypothetical protein
MDKSQFWHITQVHQKGEASPSEMLLDKWACFACRVQQKQAPTRIEWDENRCNEARSSGP